MVDCFKNAQLYRSELAEKQAEMVVLFTWLGAKQKYAHKYAKCWTRRGHDVLHVTTSVRDLLFPRSGAEVCTLVLTSERSQEAAVRTTHPYFIWMIRSHAYEDQLDLHFLPC